MAASWQPNVAEFGTWSLAAGLVIVALLVLRVKAARTRRSAELRAATRARRVATALKSAGAVLRGTPAMPGGQGSGPEAEGRQKSRRSMFLIAGGLALILLALLVPGGKDAAQDPGPGEAA